MKKIFTILAILISGISFSQSTTIVISQLYGAGGNAGAVFNADYVELHNVSSVDQSLSGLSLQYASATGTAFSSVYALPAVTLPAGAYYLVQTTTAGAGGVAITPTPDVTASPTLSLGGTNGRVALVNGTTLLTVCPDVSIIDLVGYGTANCAEGTAVPALTTTTAAIRNNNGCAETNSNVGDFTTGTPAPRNLSSTPVLCSGGPTNPVITAGSVNNFGSVTVSTASASQTFNISGFNLTGAPGIITITAPSTDFQVSADNSTWGATALVPYATASLSATPVYVRFTPQSTGLLSGNVSITGGGIAAPVNVAVTGIGTSSTPSAGALVISQVYGAGGNSGALFNADYLEIHNKSNNTQSLAGYSVQYGSAATVTTWTGKTKLPATATIPPGGYYLVQMGSTGTVGAALPTPDHIALPSISMGASNGRVALVSDTFALVACPTTNNIVDLVGYGTSVCWEGSGAVPALDTLKAGFRNNNGCDDTNNNLADFSLATPAPRNSASPVYLCTISPVLTAGTLTDFGNVTVGSSSSPQTFTLSGANLTGFPGIITITAPGADFKVSLDGINWSSSVNVPYSSATLSATTIYVLFTPQTSGIKTGNITISGGGVATAVTVAVSGTGVDPSIPSLSATALTPFGSVCVGTTAGPNSFTLTGTNLTIADISVAAVTGYAYSTTSGGSYTNTLTLTHPAGAYTQIIYVKYSPATVGNNNGNIVISGGGVATPINVAVSGSGINSRPTVVTGAATGVTTSAATLAGSITANGCTAVSAYGFEYSTTNGFTTGTVATATNLAAGAYSVNLSGLLPSTTYYYKAFATNNAGTAYGVQQSFTTVTPPPPGLSATSLTDFGTVCVGATEGPNIFTLSGVNLTAGNITVGPLTGYTFATDAAGTYSASLSINQPGGSFTQTIYVKFTPVAEAAYDGSIPVSGGGVTLLNVAVTGSGLNTPATVVTGGAQVLSPNEADLSGTLTNNGCSPVIERGIEYSGINGFANGIGTKVIAGTVSGQDFTSRVSGLIPNTTYYYKAYARSNNGIGYGDQESFTTGTLPVGIMIYGNPVPQGGEMHYSYYALKTGHYSVKIINMIGQIVYQRDVIAQVNFIDDRFNLPGFIPRGTYTLQIDNYEFRSRRRFVIQ